MEEGSSCFVGQRVSGTGILRSENVVQLAENARASWAPASLDHACWSPSPERQAKPGVARSITPPPCQLASYFRDPCPRDSIQRPLGTDVSLIKMMPQATSLPLEWLGGLGWALDRRLPALGDAGPIVMFPELGAAGICRAAWLRMESLKADAPSHRQLHGILVMAENPAGLVRCLILGPGPASWVLA